MGMIEQRRRQPGHDLISALLAAEIDGQKLSVIELLGFCSLLLVAGNETTTNLIGNAVLCFTEAPGTAERLIAEPALLPQAIEEVLRYRSPVQSMYRISAVDTTLRGRTIPAGSPIVAWIGSANRDGEQFPHPDVFDVGRSPNRHLAFGQGIHFCLGAPLARLEARIALQAVLSAAARPGRGSRGAAGADGKHDRLRSETASRVLAGCLTASAAALRPSQASVALSVTGCFGRRMAAMT